MLLVQLEPQLLRERRCTCWACNKKWLWTHDHRRTRRCEGGQRGFDSTSFIFVRVHCWFWSRPLGGKSNSHLSMLIHFCQCQSAECASLSWWVPTTRPLLAHCAHMRSIQAGKACYASQRGTMFTNRHECRTILLSHTRACICCITHISTSSIPRFNQKILTTKFHHAFYVWPGVTMIPSA